MSTESFIASLRADKQIAYHEVGPWARRWLGKDRNAPISDAQITQALQDSLDHVGEVGRDGYYADHLHRAWERYLQACAALDEQLLEAAWERSVLHSDPTPQAS